MKYRFLPVLTAILLPGLSLAQDAGSYQCSNGDLIRRVEIVYETGGRLPCEVHYHKDTEAPGESQVLWRAFSEPGYCEAKTSEFIANLEDWGWACARPTVAADPAAAGPDDTEALAPADESAHSE